MGVQNPPVLAGRLTKNPLADSPSGPPPPRFAQVRTGARPSLRSGEGGPKGRMGDAAKGVCVKVMAARHLSSAAVPLIIVDRPAASSRSSQECRGRCSTRNVKNSDRNHQARRAAGARSCRSGPWSEPPMSNRRMTDGLSASLKVRHGGSALRDISTDDRETSARLPGGGIRDINIASKYRGRWYVQATAFNFTFIISNASRVRRIRLPRHRPVWSRQAVSFVSAIDERSL